MSDQFSHIDPSGNPSMVNVGHKSTNLREATAECTIHLPEEVVKALDANVMMTKKGSVVQTAVLAGVMGAKQTGYLIPLCHPLALEDCQINITRDQSSLKITCTTRITGKTGVEMEALTGASVAALTIYDMCKGITHEITIGPLQLIAKSGGKRSFDRRVNSDETD